jgi:hypothetical protein
MDLNRESLVRELVIIVLS